MLTFVSSVAHVLTLSTNHFLTTQKRLTKVNRILGEHFEKFPLSVKSKFLALNLIELRYRMGFRNSV